MSTHLPIRILPPLHRRCALRCLANRTFSSTARTGAKRVEDPALAAAYYWHSHSDIKASRAVYQAQLEDETNLPDDQGLIPGTIIRKPIFAGGIWRDPRKWKIQIDPSSHAARGRRSVKPWYRKVWARATYEGRYCYSKVQGVVNLYRFRQSLPEENRPIFHWWFWNRSVIYDIAKEKYIRFYQCLARGDWKELSGMCLSGVRTEVRKLLTTRKQRPEWEVERDDGFKMHILSNRVARLGIPGYDETGVQQVVLRIRSQQTVRSDRTRHHYSDEHFVMQRIIIRGKVGAWKVWGFPSTGETVAGTDERGVRTPTTGLS